MQPAEFLLILLLSDGTQAVSDKTMPKIAECTELGERVVAAYPEARFDTVPYVCVSVRPGTKFSKFSGKPL